MSDFARLVSLSNPAAAGRYQPAGNGYPPSSSNANQLLDPFFDDDDEPDSAFGGPLQRMGSQQSGLALVQNAAPPAGSGLSKTSLSSEAIPADWAFDDDGFHSSPVPDSSAFSASSSAEHIRTTPQRKKWKWPWQKDKVVKGDRIIALNDRTANVDFCSNFVSTSKYNLATFVPKFFTGMSRKCMLVYIAI